MPRPPSGRRPDSLFDNRYRYDFIYPRGRSGETLRAYDTLDGDQPVVIKRPAPQDAPPIRAGQESSILNEKRVLEQLAGHPALTELRHIGTFRVGGQAHQYIALDVAQGEVVETLVLDLAAQGKLLPELELFVILDNLLDLLECAHERKIIYNDVDARHLFWDRANYRLKVIDWGNAVFLDSEDAPTHISQTTDILQIGQLIYFMVSGGKRLEIGQTDPTVDLGESVSTRLKAIIDRAANPEASQRYPDILSLRQDLAEILQPLAKARDLILERVRVRLQTADNDKELTQLRIMLFEALEADPGYPAARQLLADIENRLKQLAIQGDLQAARRHIESGKMAQAAALLESLRPRLNADQPIIEYLLDLCHQLEGQTTLPAGLSPALDALLKGDVQSAGRILVTTPESRPGPYMQQLLLAERLTLVMPGLTLLRPHLARLESEQPDAARAVSAMLNDSVAPGIQATLQFYQRIVDELAALETNSDNPAGRARTAAQHMVGLLQDVAQNALSDPNRAESALWEAAAIDPINAAFEAIHHQLSEFHQTLEHLKAFEPDAEGATIVEFIAEAQTALRPYAHDISDAKFQAMLQGIDTAITSWAAAVDFMTLGGRRPAVEACKNAANGIHSLNPATARWFEEYSRKIETSPRVERQSPNPAFGQAMAEGWEAWDRGKTAEAKTAGEQATQLAKTDSERLAARRLIDLSEALGAWLKNDGSISRKRTDEMEDQVVGLFLPEEETVRRKFSAQMPNMQIYLRAMMRGIVEPMQESSAAAVRILFFDYVLNGILALHDEKPEDADFWKEAALKTLGNARTHPAYHALDVAMTRRQLILDAVRLLNNVRHASDLAEARVAVRAPLAAAQLEYADQALKAIDEALRRWPDGEFRIAKQQLENALDDAISAERLTGKDLTQFKNWLQELIDSAELLQQTRRTIEQAALVPEDAPDPAVTEAHQRLIDVTRRDLGEAFTPLLRQWRDTYQAITDLYLGSDLSKHEKMRQVDSQLAAPFMDQHPALPIFQHWQSLIRLLPEPKPVEVEPFEERPAADEQHVIDNSEERNNEPVEYDIQPMIRKSAPGDGVPRSVFIGGALIAAIAIVAIGFLIIQRRGNGSAGSADATGDSAALVNTSIPTNTLESFTETPLPTDTDIPSPTEKPYTLTPIPTITRSVPTPTRPTDTPTQGPPTATSEASLTPSDIPTLGSIVLPGSPAPTSSVIAPPTDLPAAEGGDYDVLKSLEDLPTTKISWNKDWFGPLDEGWQLGTATMKAKPSLCIVRIGPDILTALYGVDAARHLTRMEVTVELTHYEPSLLPTGQVYFGIGLEAVLSGQHATTQAMLIQPNVVNLGVNLTGTFVSKTQLPIRELHITLQRNSDRTISLYLDNTLLGQSNAAYKPNDPVGIYMYTSTGGVVVTVKSLSIHLE